MTEKPKMTYELAVKCLEYREESRCSWRDVKNYFELGIEEQSIMSYCSKVRRGHITDTPKERNTAFKRIQSEEEAYKDPRWDIISKPII